MFNKIECYLLEISVGDPGFAHEILHSEKRRRFVEVILRRELRGNQMLHLILNRKYSVTGQPVGFKNALKSFRKSLHFISDACVFIN